jgi:uncharacterized protein
MPHQCVRCSTLYPDGAQEILKGCSCGARLFFYVKKQHIKEGKELISKLSVSEKEQIEDDILEIARVRRDSGISADANELVDGPVVLDFESIRIMKPGKYELDLVSIFKKNPLVFKLEEGKYVIDILQAFENNEK